MKSYLIRLVKTIDYESALLKRTLTLPTSVINNVIRNKTAKVRDFNLHFYEGVKRKSPHIPKEDIALLRDELQAQTVDQLKGLIENPTTTKIRS